MSGEQQAQEIPLADEGSWAYLIAPGGGEEGADPLRDRVAETCEAGGWPMVRRSPAEAGDTEDPGDFFEGVRHAVENADVVVALLGGGGAALDAELALAYGHRRPIVGVRLGHEASYSSAVQAMLERYERARVVTGEDPDGCAARLRDLFSDSDFALTVRAAGGERVGHV
jgi:hypothetical protein